MTPATPITPISPPVPAPYLAGAPQLPDELLAELAGKTHVLRPLDERAQALIGTIAANIRFRREAYEGAHNVTIVPERPTL